jgi:hypothetical protein
MQQWQSSTAWPAWSGNGYLFVLFFRIYLASLFAYS